MGQKSAKTELFALRNFLFRKQGSVGDDKPLIGSRKLLEGCPRPLQSHHIEHLKGHFVLMDQVLTQTALSAVLVRTTNTAVRKQAQ